MPDLEQLRQLATHDPEAQAELLRQRVRLGELREWTLTINGEEITKYTEEPTTVVEIQGWVDEVVRYSSKVSST